MRVVQFLQVMILLLLLGYLLLVALENPVLLHLPIPFSEREWRLSAGMVLFTALLLGVAYGAFLVWPLLLTRRRQYLQVQLRRRQAESHLQAALRARSAAPVTEVSLSSTMPEPTPSENTP